MNKIKLTQGYEVIVDEDMFEYLNQWKWYYNAGYAMRGFYKGTGRQDAKMEKIMMHRVVNNTPKGFETDHINRNKLDNRKENLRTVTTAENNLNKGIRKDNFYGVRGIFWNKKNKRWRAAISIDRKKINLGSFINKDDAIRVRREAEFKYHGI